MCRYFNEKYFSISILEFAELAGNKKRDGMDLDWYDIMLLLFKRRITLAKVITKPLFIKYCTII